MKSGQFTQMSALPECCLCGRKARFDLARVVPGRSSWGYACAFHWADRPLGIGLGQLLTLKGEDADAVLEQARIEWLKQHDAERGIS